MSAMKEIYMDMAQDFENLSETSMKFKGVGWEKQDGRFIGKVDYSMDYIYWFDNYVSVMAARTILQDFGNQYEIIFDDNMGQWAIITEFQALSWGE